MYLSLNGEKEKRASSIILKEKFRTRGTVFVSERERPALELRSYDTLAINYSRIMSGPGAHCLPWDRVGGEGGEKELLHVGSFFLRRFSPFSTPTPFWARPWHPDTRNGGTILRGNLRFYRKFIRGAVRANPGAEIGRTSYDPRNSKSTTWSRFIHVVYTTPHIAVHHRRE